MSSLSKTNKYCCTCQHFGGKAQLKGSIVEFENGMHAVNRQWHPLVRNGKNVKIEYINQRAAELFNRSLLFI